MASFEKIETLVCEVHKSDSSGVGGCQIFPGVLGGMDGDLAQSLYAAP